MRPRDPRNLAPGHVCELVVAARDGSDLTVIYETGEQIEAPNWTPDGKWLIYSADGRLFRISPDGQVGPEGGDTLDIDLFNGGQGTMNVASWAPDSRRFAHVRYPLRARGPRLVWRGPFFMLSGLGGGDRALCHHLDDIGPVIRCPMHV